MMDNEKKPGATGKFPDGKINESDDGELNMAVGIDPTSQTVVIDFGTPTVWLGMPKDQARSFGQMIIDKSEEL